MQCSMRFMICYNGTVIEQSKQRVGIRDGSNRHPPEIIYYPSLRVETSVFRS